jgi:cytoplasmic iron level regulating protein YaaA (DUF328/UPF0246 family)
MKTLHVYFPECQIDRLKSFAREQQVSVSSVLRGLVAGNDPIRNYRTDGQHTKERMTENAINNILRKVAH